MIDNLEQVISRASDRDIQRTQVINELREQTGILLDKHGKRRPNAQFWFGLPIFPIALPLISGAGWLMHRINPIDIHSKKVLKTEFSEFGDPKTKTRLVVVSSSVGDMRRAYNLSIDIKNVSKIDLMRERSVDYPSLADITIYHPEKETIWVTGKEKREATLEELLAFRPLINHLQQVLPVMSHTNAELRPI